MTPNTAQRLYLIDNPKLEEFKGNREIILKARQMGFTTFIAAKMFLNTINVPNTQSIIVCQDEINAKRVFGIIKRFYNNLPPYKKIPTTVESAGELTWGSIDSSFFVGWAGSKKLGRGGTINHFHGSEVAFWENPTEIIGGLLPSVPQDGNIFLESTANGVGNYYFKEYKDAEDNNSLYKARFYPWYIDPEYVAYKLANDEEFILNQEEEGLIERFQLSIPQLIWRRNEILGLKNAHLAGDDSRGLFPQEYPSTSSEAFLTTGATFFNTEIIENQLMPRTSPPLTLEIPLRYPKLREINGQGLNRLDLWSQPKSGKRYLIVADPAEGINDYGDHDYCSADIIDFDTWEQVGQLYGRWEPNDFAELLNDLGRWFNTALLAVLRNNHGHSVLNSLINQFEYPKQSGCHGLYYYRDFDLPKTKRIAPRPGFPENVKTKSLILDAANNVITDGSLLINSKRTCEQLKFYLKLPGGKTGCLIGHDDCVSSISLGCYILTEPRIVRKADKAASDRPKTGISTTRKGQFV